MTWNLTLDILLVVLVLLFAPIGYMRGPVKELLVALGVAFGALTVEFWARPWGRDLDFYFDVGDDPGAFIVAMSILMATTFIGGYGLGLLIAPWTFSIRGRMLGALISAINGALLVAFSLQYVRLFLLSDANEEALEESYSVSLLMNEVGWILLGGIAIVPVAILYGLITRRRAYDLRIWDDYDEEDEYYEDYDPAYDYLDDEALEPEPETWAPQRSETSHMAETRVMPPRVPPTPPAEEPGYKAEPEPIPFRVPDATRPIGVAELDDSLKEESAVSPEDLGGEWFAIGDTDPSMVNLDTAALEEIDEADIVEPDDSEAGEAGEPLPEGYSRCQACHAVLPPGTGICPVCGHVH